MTDTQKTAVLEGKRFEESFKQLLKEHDLSHGDNRHPLTKFYDYVLDEPAHLDFVLPELQVVIECKTMSEWEKKHFQMIDSYANKHKRGVFDFPNGETPTFWYIIERTVHRSALRPKIVSRLDTQYRQYNEWYNPQGFHLIYYDHDTMKGLIHEKKTSHQG